MFISISKEFEDYDFAVFNGKRTLNLTAGARSLTLKPGDTFGYRSARNLVYIVMPERGLNYEYKITEDDFDRRIAPKSDEVKPAKAKKLFAAPIKKEDPLRPSKTGKKVGVLPKAPMAPVQRPPAKEQEKTQDVEEHALVKAFGNPARFSRISTVGDAISYLIEVWTKVNTLKCNNQLVRPTFIITKDMGASTRRMGYWSPVKRVLGVSPRLFRAKEHIALTTIVHEIAHEAVTDIAKIPHEGKDGHGPIWAKWMTTFGLTPSRYSQYDTLEYFDEHEKKQIAQRNKEKQDRFAELMDQNRNQEQQKFLPGYYKPAQYYNTTQKQWIKGMVAVPNDKAMKRCTFVRPGATTQYDIVPADWFYTVPDGTFSTEQLAQLRTLAERIAAHMDLKSQTRQLRRTLRYGA